MDKMSCVGLIIGCSTRNQYTFAYKEIRRVELTAASNNAVKELASGAEVGDKVEVVDRLDSEQRSQYVRVACLWW